MKLSEKWTTTPDAIASLLFLPLIFKQFFHYFICKQNQGKQHFRSATAFAPLLQPRDVQLRKCSSRYVMVTTTNETLGFLNPLLYSLRSQGNVTAFNGKLLFCLLIQQTYQPETISAQSCLGSAASMDYQQQLDGMQ